MTIALMACIWLIGIAVNIDKLPPNDKGRKSGDIIYQWNQRKTRIRKYHAYGSSTCRPQIYVGWALPFQPRWREGHKSGDLDYCTGEVYVNGKWQYFESLIDNEVKDEKKM
jgi:hypothetical protein